MESTTRIPPAAVRRALLRYYDRAARDLVWRRTRDPYHIWISEIMLQQTRAATVEPRWLRFIERFPDVAALAAAPAEQVCEEWAGLGYYSRARNLHAAARAVVERHGGQVPADVAALRALPGIGPYTAGAIGSIAFGIESPVLDGNVARVLSRLLALDGPVKDPAIARELWSHAARLARGRRPGAVNEALMDLGATVCTPRRPACTQCPVSRWCAAERLGTPERFPAKTAAAQRKRLVVAFAWVSTRSGVWLERRPIEGLWAGLWQLPGTEGHSARARLAERFGVVLESPIATVEHTLTHRDVCARVYRVRGSARGLGLRRGPALGPHRDPLSAALSGLAGKAIVAVRRAGP